MHDSTLLYYNRYREIHSALAQQIYHEARSATGKKKDNHVGLFVWYARRRILFPAYSRTFIIGQIRVMNQQDVEKALGGLQHPTLRFAEGSSVIPGDRLGTVRQVLPGVGTYVKGGNVYASVVGTLQVSRTNYSSTQADETPVTPPDYEAIVLGFKGIASQYVISIGDAVLGRILRISNQQAFVEILAKDGVGLLPKSCEGCIRREDVRSLASEDVKLQDNFLPGDIVLAKVLSLGDSRRYLLSTAAPELGVIYATSFKSGLPMVPKSWKETETGHVEPRKLAKPRDVTESAASFSIE